MGVDQELGINTLELEDGSIVVGDLSELFPEAADVDDHVEGGEGLELSLAPVPPSAVAASATDLALVLVHMDLADIRRLAASMGLATTGKKHAVVKRLAEYTIQSVAGSASSGSAGAAAMR